MKKKKIDWNKMTLSLCLNCYGKGYFTQLQGISWRGGNRQTWVIRLCDCGRGKDLKKYFTIKKKNKRLY